MGFCGRSPTLQWLVLPIVLLLALVTACSDDQSMTDDDVDTSTNAPSAPIGESQHAVAELAFSVRTSELEQLQGETFTIEAFVNPPPDDPSVSSVPSQGCPIVPEKQKILSDQPVLTQIEVAGASIPNAVDESGDYLRLVVPLQLGFLDIPDRAILRGTFFHADYVNCPRPERLFILEDVIDELAVDSLPAAASPISDWERWSDSDSGMIVEYPAGWEVEVQEREGHRYHIRFLGGEPFRPIRLSIEPGETWWDPNNSANVSIPDVLRGQRHFPAVAGPATARLVEDSSRTGSGERELRLVFNHRGNTVALAMIIRDGVELHHDGVHVFSEMAHRLRLQGEVVLSDPMDPVLAASDDLGDGPFLSEEDARYLAVSASGMTNVETMEADLVSPRAARLAVAGACRDFEGDPEGVWLVTVQGVLPSGRDTYRLVYIDAENGARLCQTEAPGVT
jgi:hypothetical protein